MAVLFYNNLLFADENKTYDDYLFVILYLLDKYIFSPIIQYRHGAKIRMFQLHFFKASKNVYGWTWVEQVALDYKIHS